MDAKRNDRPLDRRPSACALVQITRLQCTRVATDRTRVIRDACRKEILVNVNTRHRYNLTLPTTSFLSLATLSSFRCARTLRELFRVDLFADNRDVLRFTP